MVKTGNQPPPSGMSGPANTPSFDVFGSWTVYHYENLAPTGSCPDTVSTLPPRGELLDTKPGNPPPSPGWPVSAP